MKTDNQYNRSILLAAMKNTQGKFFTVHFTKKDGSDRVMNARLGVKKHLKGGANTVAHLEQYVAVFEPATNSYKNVNLDTIYKIKASGLILDIERVA